MEPSVLERQRAILRHLYQGGDSWKPPQYDHHSPHHHAFSAVSDVSNSPVATSPPPTLDCQCNSDTPNRHDNPKKRKAEIDDEEAGEEKSEITMKTEKETSSNTCSKENSKASEEGPKPDYIHVRARRGQATDSHSLAERARREKISKKMKCLQDLVPGCNRVTGKAGMLDEIINYVQSLQKQVEFLSMKLAAVNPRLDFSIDEIFAKEVPAYIAGLPATPPQFEAANSICIQYNPIQQGTSNCGPDMPIDQSHVLLQRAAAGSLSIPEVFLDSSFPVISCTHSCLIYFHYEQVSCEMISRTFHDS